MMSAAHARFTFDLDLNHTKRRDRAISEAGLEALVEAARRQGYAEGLAEGEHTALADNARSLALAAQALADRSAAMAQSLESMRRGTLAEAVELAAGIGRKLAGHLLDREPAAELEALIGECLASLDRAPHLVVRCHPDLAERIRAFAERQAAGSGFSGRLIVEADPAFAISDGRLDWADGGLVRSTADISASIDRRIAAYLAARAATDTSETEF